ncbi:MAG: nitroreductase family protein, partial [Gaiellaceae bacterium]
MELRDILRRRRMHRAFLPDPIPREQIERIAGVIRRAPSGGFSQGGSIVVVTDAAKRKEIAERFDMAGTYVEAAPVHMVIS